MNLVLNAHTKQLFDHYARTLPQALLVVGERGLGAATIARSVANHHTNAVYTIQPELLTKSSSTPTISIEKVRDLVVTTRSSTNVMRVIHIEDAHMMTPQAQNAFLKLLEEPTPNTHYILSAHTDQAFLSTVLSRVQLWRVQPLSTALMQELLALHPIADDKAKAQALFVANGKPAELIRITNDPESLADYAQRIADAKLFLQGESYQKITCITRYKDSRPQTLLLLEFVLRLLTLSMASSPQPEPLRHKAEQILTAYERIRANGNIRLILLRYML